MPISKICTDCNFSDRKKIKHRGSLSGEILIVSDMPNEAEITGGRCVSGKHGQLLTKVLQESKIPTSMIYAMNATRCPEYEEEDTTRQKNQALAQCRGFLKVVVDKMKPKLIISLGKTALKQTLNATKLMDNKCRFIWSEEFNCFVFVSVGLEYPLLGSTVDFLSKTTDGMATREKTLFNDFERVREFVENDFAPIETDVTSYIKTDSYTEFLDAKTVAIDIESTGLDTVTGTANILSVSLTKDVGSAKVSIIKDNIVPPTFKEIMANPKIAKVVAHRPFDELMLKNMGDSPIIGDIHDVLQIEHLLDENGYRYNLDTIVNNRTSMSNIKDIANEIYNKDIDPDEIEDKSLVIRTGLDTDGTLRTFKAQARKLNEDKELLLYYKKFIMPTSTMLSETYEHGCFIDIEALKIAEQEIAELMAIEHEKALNELPQALKEKHSEGKNLLKLSRKIITKDYLFDKKLGLGLKPVGGYITKKTKQPQITDEHLKLFNHLPYIQYYLRWATLAKLLTSYVNNFWKHIHNDNYVYPTTVLNRTVTGRTACMNPAIQTIPQRGDHAHYIKACFAAEEGWSLGARDLSTSEMRIIGWLAQDKNILGAINNGIDIHKRTAMAVYKCFVEDVTKPMRQASKATGFGFIYGMSSHTKSGGGFQKYAKDLYGIDYTVDECVNIRKAFFAKPDGFYALPEYHRTQIDFVNKHGYVRSPLGRIRRLPDGMKFGRDDWGIRSRAERQAINFPTQSFSSDFALIAMTLFHNAIKASDSLRDNVKTMFFIHDSITFRARHEYVEEAMLLLKDCMENRAKQYVLENFGIEVGYDVESDGKVGTNWANMEEIDY